MKTAKIIIVILLLTTIICGFNSGMAQSDSYLADAPLDFSDAANWIVFNDGEDTDVDFFCIAPTVSSGEGHNMPADELSSLTGFLIQTNVYRELFAPTARTFSPVYRQIT